MRKFSFYHNVFKSQLLQTGKNAFAGGKGIMLSYQYIFSIDVFKIISCRFVVCGKGLTNDRLGVVPCKDTIVAITLPHL